MQSKMSHEEEILEEIKATTTSFGFSRRTSAGLLFVLVKSVKGNGNNTILPFIYIALSSLDLYISQVLFLKIP